MSLGTWQYGFIPGIHTTPQIADDVNSSNLLFPHQHLEVGPQGMDAVLLNAKGFGGNNASAPVLSPTVTEQLLERRHGARAMTHWRQQREAAIAASAAYEDAASKGLSRPIYRYDNGVLEGSDLQISDSEVRLPGYEQAVSLIEDNPFKDMC
jgi:acetoacetyl-[acyl-carrier protein] synthase